MEGDSRGAWMCSRVVKGLDIGEGLFTDLLTEKDSDRPVKERFLAEFDGGVYTLTQFLEGDTPVRVGGAVVSRQLGSPTLRVRGGMGWGWDFRTAKYDRRHPPLSVVVTDRCCRSRSIPPPPPPQALFFFLNMESKDPSAADQKAQPKVGVHRMAQPSRTPSSSPPSPPSPHPLR